MALPSTGGNYATVLQPSLNPLAVRYWQITDVLIQDYFNANGVPNNWAASSVGLGTAGLFTPFAADGTIRQDLLIGSGAPNQGFYHAGELKEDVVAVTNDITVQETPTAQSVRTVREVITKLDDKVNFTMLEAGPLQDYLRYELPLANGIPDIGTKGYQVARGPMDQLIDRTICLIGVDSDGQLRAEFFPRVCPNKKDKTDLQRKNPESLGWTGTALPDPISGQVMWVCREGANWRSLGGVPVLGTVTPTPITGLKVTLVFTVSGLDVGALTASSFAATKTTGGTTTALTLTGSPGIVTSAGVTTVTLTGSGLAATTVYTGTITVTGDNGATSTVPIPSFTSTAS